MDILHVVTGLGDSALLLPGSLALFAYLAWRGQLRLALAWLAALALCFLLTVAAKLVFLACGGRMPLLRIESPSGHASFSAAFYGACAVVAALNRPRLHRLAIHAGALALATAIGLSRALLGYHSPEEVLAGLLIGGLCVSAFAWLGRSAAEAPLRVLPLASVLVLLAFALGGRHLSIEPVLERFADRLSPALGCAL